MAVPLTKKPNFLVARCGSDRDLALESHREQHVSLYLKKRKGFSQSRIG
jgi:hypothetical protein